MKVSRKRIFSLKYKEGYSDAIEFLRGDDSVFVPYESGDTMGSLSKRAREMDYDNVCSDALTLVLPPAAALLPFLSFLVVVSGNSALACALPPAGFATC